MNIENKKDLNNKENINENRRLKPDVSVNGLEINTASYRVYVDGNEKKLTNLEYKLLLFLAEKPDRVFTYQQIYESVWEEPYTYEKGNIMTHISHLKSKIESDPVHSKFIENIRGVGYRFKR